MPSSGYSATIGVFYALDEDLTGLMGVDAKKTTVDVAGRSVSLVEIGHHRVVAAKMDAGSVATAITTQAVLGRYRCDYVFSIGPAGALDRTISKGTWLRVKRVVPYQVGSATDSGFQITDKKFDTSTVNSLPISWAKVRSVSIASGETFVADDSTAQRIAEETGCQLVDMNSFGLSASCQSLRIPFSIWKIVSDDADKNASEDFRKFSKEYQGTGGRILNELIMSLPESLDSLSSYKNINRLLEQ